MRPESWNRKVVLALITLVALFLACNDPSHPEVRIAGTGDARREQ